MVPCSGLARVEPESAGSGDDGGAEVLGGVAWWHGRQGGAGELSCLICGDPGTQIWLFLWWQLARAAAPWPSLGSLAMDVVNGV